MALAYEEIRARRITPDTTVPQHDFLFRWGNQPCYARGELVALTGKAKSGKTFVCSILMALGIRPQLMGLSRLHDEPLRVVWIDTEQSEDSTHEILCHRIGSLIGGPIPDDQYFVYNLRRDNWQDRL
ncbi:MAG: AAA family ATPase, partial [Paludibacteraceae bacterium]|nr:AAA family ATPase [Paludibacteraceae bacterium]